MRWALFHDGFDIRDYRYSVWITNSEEQPYEVCKKCRPRANDENTVKELKEDCALGGFSMKKFYCTEAARLIRVLIYNLFVLFRYEMILAKKEKTQRLKTLSYKYFVMPAHLGGDGKKLILRISVFTQKLKSKLIYMYNRIQQYCPYGYAKCTAFG